MLGTPPPAPAQAPVESCRACTKQKAPRSPEPRGTSASHLLSWPIPPTNVSGGPDPLPSLPPSLRLKIKNDPLSSPLCTVCKHAESAPSPHQQHLSAQRLAAILQPHQVHPSLSSAHDATWSHIIQQAWVTPLRKQQPSPPLWAPPHGCVKAKRGKANGAARMAMPCGRGAVRRGDVRPIRTLVIGSHRGARGNDSAICKPDDGRAPRQTEAAVAAPTLAWPRRFDLAHPRPSGAAP